MRAIPAGRRNWLFAWTELGAQRVGLIQSLIVTCRLQGERPNLGLWSALAGLDTGDRTVTQAANPHQSPILDSDGIFVWIDFILSFNGRILSWRRRLLEHLYDAMSVFLVGFMSFRWVRRRTGER